MHRPRTTQLRGGGRFVVEALATSPPQVVKSGDPAALAREARALRLIAGHGVGPDLIAAEPGRVTTARLPGRPQSLTKLGRDEAGALGQLLRRAHGIRPSRTGGLPGWPSRAGTLEAYRRRRAADAVRVAGVHGRLARRIVRGLPPLPDERRATHPFALLHGDLTARNVVWGPDPKLVDWEFWRSGDPAEDLAYLFALNDIPPHVAEGILTGYCNPQVSERIAGWRPLCLLDGGLWYANSGFAERATPLLTAALQSVQTSTQM